jgi:4-amino-4-deoxy-L-arabinose transferase-like glycosyltransferase
MSFISNTMAWYWYVFGIVEVIGFFYFSNKLTCLWSEISEKTFVRRLFTLSFAIRLGWVIFSYWFYIYQTGNPFEFEVADAFFYDEMGRFGSHLLSEGNIAILPFLDTYAGGLAYSDSGYPLYLSFIYFLTGDSIFITRIIKALLSAFTCLLIYRLSVRTFDVKTGRMAAIFCMLMPNLIYYCGLHLKETEMLFLTVAFIERADYVMRSRKFNFVNILLPLLLASSLFFFRTVLGIATLFSFFTSLIFSSQYLLKGSRRMVLIVWILLVVAYFMSGRITMEIEAVWNGRFDDQNVSLQWRADREGGNKFAQYASKSVFAPMIFVIPFPTMVNIEIQQNQQLIHGGNYVKNVMAFFCMFALIWVVRKHKWRNYTLVGAFILSYLIIVSVSAFAHSERFHLPALPFELMMAAYGVSLMTNTTKKYFNTYLLFIFIAILIWNWYKLAGRGLI